MSSVIYQFLRKLESTKSHGHRVDVPAWIPLRRASSRDDASRRPGCVHAPHDPRSVNDLFRSTCMSDNTAFWAVRGIFRAPSVISDPGGLHQLSLRGANLAEISSSLLFPEVSHSLRSGIVHTRVGSRVWVRALGATIARMYARIRVCVCEVRVCASLVQVYIYPRCESATSCIICGQRGVNFFGDRTSFYVVFDPKEEWMRLYFRN